MPHLRFPARWGAEPDIPEEDTEQTLKEQISKCPFHGLSLQVQEQLFAVWGESISLWAVPVLVKSSLPSRESWRGKLPTSVYCTNNKHEWQEPPIPAFPTNLTGGAYMEWRQGEKMGEN